MSGTNRHREGEKEGSLNLVELKPSRTARSTTGPDGTVVVFVPKFTGKLALRWLVPLLANPDMELRLDEIGSFFWNQCDGRSTVGEISSRMSDRFGGETGPMLDRISVFMRRLDESKLIDIHGSSGPPEDVLLAAPDSGRRDSK